MTRSRVRLFARAAVLALAVGLFSGAPGRGGMTEGRAYGQNIGQRVVEGKVVDSSLATVDGATVFLKNLKTKAIRSYATTGDGRFRFTQVNMAEDHELWAEKADRKSAVKSISSWDSRTTFECELKLK